MGTTLRWTAADLEVLPDDGTRYEIIDGELYVSRQPGYHHQYVCSQLNIALGVWSNQTNIGVTLQTPGVIFADDDDVVPDVDLIMGRAKSIFHKAVASAKFTYQEPILLLTQLELEHVLRQVQTAFPNLVDWEYNNKVDADYCGFTIWGCFVPQEDAESLSERRFYVTFDIYQDTWRGTLTIGQPFYLWTSADVGDAHLVSTEPCTSLAQAIAALKVNIADLAKAFSAL